MQYAHLPNSLPFIDFTVGQPGQADVLEMLLVALIPDLPEEKISETWDLCAHKDFLVISKDGSLLDPSVFAFDQDDHRLVIADSLDNSAVGTYDLKL